MKPRVSIIGRGNVAVHLSRALSNGAHISMVNPHTLKDLDATPDVCLIAVSDDAIAEVAARLTDLDCIVAHTSGTTPIEVLREAGVKRPGVFYPLQTFSKDVELDYSPIPVFVEGNTPDIEWILSDIGSLFSSDVRKADSVTRRRLHLASVYACNFVNHLWTLAEETLAPSSIDFGVLKPLIGETMRKAMANSPATSQTGPARRHDRRTMDAHVQMLDGHPDLQKIYRELSTSIENHYPNECH